MGIFRLSRAVCAVLALFMAFSVTTATEAQEKDLFTQLRGNWGGSGIMYLSDNRKSRIACNASYSGTASQLSLSIRCDSDYEDVRLRASLSRNSGRLSGTWKEETYNAVGAISGGATANRLTFQIGGNVMGKMTVNYSGRRQQVMIETLAIPLERIEINMTKR